MVSVTLVLLAAEALGRNAPYSAARMSAASLQDEREAADRYARSSNLPTLHDGGPDEVRVWWRAFGGAPASYVPTYGRSQVCSIDEQVNPRSGRCKPYAPRMTREQVRTWLLRLQAFADHSIVCEMQDGDWVTIDAVVDGKRFVVSADNPSACDGDAARLVAKFLRKIDTGRPPTSSG